MYHKCVVVQCNQRCVTAWRLTFSFANKNPTVMLFISEHALCLKIKTDFNWFPFSQNQLIDFHSSIALPLMWWWNFMLITVSFHGHMCVTMEIVVSLSVAYRGDGLGKLLLSRQTSAFGSVAHQARGPGDRVDGWCCWHVDHKLMWMVSAWCSSTWMTVLSLGNFSRSCFCSDKRTL